MEQKTTITLAGTENPIQPDKVYMVDWSKMKSVNDMVLILASMGMAFPGNHPNIEQIKHLLNTEQPLPTGPQKGELQLPKLKTLK